LARSAPIRPKAEVAPLLLVVMLISVACASTPPPGRHDIRVIPPGGSKPHSIAVLELPPDRSALLDALDRTGLGLRGSGIRYTPLDPRAEQVVLDAFGSAPGAPFTSGRFADGDVIEVSILKDATSPVGFTLYLVPEEGRGTTYRAGASVRPANGALLPVLRGELPVRASGAFLVVGEFRHSPAFAAILRFGVEGLAPLAGIHEPSGHRLRRWTFALSSVDLAETLNALDLGEPGGPGGLAALSVPAGRVDSTLAALRRHGDPDVDRFGSVPAEFAVGRLRVRLDSDFSVAVYRYRSKLVAEDRPEIPPLGVEHEAGEAILLVAWDADGPGRSRAVVLRLTPVR
jgi:hypothetical protein